MKNNNKKKESTIGPSVVECLCISILLAENLRNNPKHDIKMCKKVSTNNPNQPTRKKKYDS